MVDEPAVGFRHECGAELLVRHVCAGCGESVVPGSITTEARSAPTT
ncbi:hypothetical protein [Umezawaea sp. Da 62-37]|nr:hypothetical protein [Umezawaea sp. Da 62-37]WNV85586.1 hypothetical protein RM788_46960 [Umezawaea sp. Da 62-37]